jgi:F0F1-type ATP synthase gamma subunit
LRVANRVERAQRLTNVLHVVEKIGRNALADADQAVARSRSAHDELVALLSTDQGLAGLLSDVLAKRLRKLSTDIERQTRHRLEVAERWRTRRLRRVAAEQLLKNAVMLATAEADNKELAELLEQLRSAGAQGPGKQNA